MKTMINHIKQLRFQASFGKIVTCQEGGIKLTLNIPETDKKIASETMYYDRCIFDIILTIKKPETIGSGEDEI